MTPRFFSWIFFPSPLVFSSLTLISRWLLLLLLCFFVLFGGGGVSGLLGFMVFHLIIYRTFSLSLKYFFCPFLLLLEFQLQVRDNIIDSALNLSQLLDALCFSFCFSLGNFYSPIFKFTSSFLRCQVWWWPHQDGLSDTVGFPPPAFLFDFLTFPSLLKFSVGAYCLLSQLDPLLY